MIRVEEGRLQKGGNNGIPVNPPPRDLRPEPPQSPAPPQTDPQPQNTPNNGDGN